ncbi:MAG: hypothetical protein ACK4OM_00835 [Alphaproteobacteria bacterium]
MNSEYYFTPLNINSFIGKGFIEETANMLTTSKLFKIIKISNHFISDKDALSLSQMIIKSSYIKSLDLRDNSNISNNLTVTKILCDAFKQSKSIIAIGLDNIFIEVNTNSGELNLKEFDSKGNKISTKQKNLSIQSINLVKNNPNLIFYNDEKTQNYFKALEVSDIIINNKESKNINLKNIYLSEAAIEYILVIEYKYDFEKARNLINKSKDSFQYTWSDRIVKQHQSMILPKDILNNIGKYLSPYDIKPGKPREASSYTELSLNKKSKCQIQ